jgi:hypothetical protein
MALNRFAGYVPVVLAGAAALAVLAELAAVAFYFAERHELYYTRPAGQVEAIPPSLALTTFRVSPYLGFMRAPGQPLTSIVAPERLQRMAAPVAKPAWVNARTNNHGFLSEHDYPFAPSAPNAFVVGIFGGSVAQWFAVQGAQPLIADLQVAPGLRDRNIIVLDFAADGYKQPQQLLLLNYLLATGQRLDYVINIDGFNEITLAAVNVEAGTDAAMPSIRHMAPLANLARLRMDSAELLQLAALSDAQRRLAEAQATVATHSIAVGWAIDEMSIRALTRRVNALAQSPGPEAGTESLIALAPAAAPTGDGIGQAVALWAQASRLMQHTLEAQDVPYLHVVQPNQYFGRKPLSAEEALSAVNPDSPYRKQVASGYPLLRAAVPGLRSDGVAVIDATALFDRDAETVYADDCCHYNQRGNDKLARFIARAIIAGAPQPAARVTVPR